MAVFRPCALIYYVHGIAYCDSRVISKKNSVDQGSRKKEGRTNKMDLKLVYAKEQHSPSLASRGMTAMECAKQPSRQASHWLEKCPSSNARPDRFSPARAAPTLRTVAASCDVKGTDVIL